MSKRILLVKLTSLGDLIHALPALTDAKLANPDLKVDWAIDENFQEIATWHPAIIKTFTTNHRLWRKNLFSALSPIYQCIRDVRNTKYDLVVDGQGNFKSALLCLFAKGPRAGFDRHSVREAIAHLAYQKKYAVSKKEHAILRLRKLFSLALNYPLPTTPPDFALCKEKFRPPPFSLPSRFLVFIHNASWNTKLWPEEHWKVLIRKAKECGYPVLLPHGNDEEKQRAERLAKEYPNAYVLPKLSLSEIAYILSKAKACVTVDTGLSHLAAALNVPSVTLYGATDSGLIGALGEGQTHLLSRISCSPCNQKQCRIEGGNGAPPCLREISPETVWGNVCISLSK